jgi:hypothetical protein
MIEAPFFFSLSSWGPVWVIQREVIYNRVGALKGWLDVDTRREGATGLGVVDKNVSTQRI